MGKVLNILVVVIGLLFLAMGLQWAFTFDAVSQQWAVNPLNTTGMNNLRGDIGGMFLASAVFCGLYFRQGAQWLYAAAVLMGCIASMRILSLLVDGFSAEAAQSLAGEIIFIIVFVATAKRSKQ
jgi:hypothetical protein